MPGSSLAGTLRAGRPVMPAGPVPSTPVTASAGDGSPTVNDRRPVITWLSAETTR
jgi:hypothetical protein